MSPCSFCLVFFSTLFFFSCSSDQFDNPLIDSIFYSHCNLKYITNQNFSSFYQLEEILFHPLNGNHKKFSCENFYHGIIAIEAMGKVSYIMDGKKGTGKSSIIKCNPASSKWIIPLKSDIIKRSIKEFHKQIGEKIPDSKEDHISTNIKVHWNNKHFAHLVLSALVGYLSLSFLL